MSKKQHSELEDYLIEHISIPTYFNKYLADKSKGINELSDLTGTATVCPFHDDVNPSFRYWKAKNLFVCFGCHVSGDVINLHRLTLQRKRGGKVTRAYAVQDLCSLYGIKTVKTEEEAEKLAQEGTTDSVVVEKSIFQRARENLDLNKALMDNRRQFNLLTFRRNNEQIKANSNLDEDSRFKAYDELDLMASVALAATNEQLSVVDNMTLADIDAAI